MVLKLYGSPISTCTQRVLFALFEKEVPFEFISVDLLKGESHTAEFRAKQPFGQVPYIDDDGFVLYESRAISLYIAEKYADQGTPNLGPSNLKDAKSRALFTQAASVEASNFDQFAGPAIFEALFKPKMGMQSSKEKFDDLIASLSRRLDAYDEILSKQKYLTGESITLVDLFHVPYGVLLEPAGANVIKPRPNVKRWMDDMTSRPSWKKIQEFKGAF